MRLRRLLPDAWQGAIAPRVFRPYGDILPWVRQNVRVCLDNIKAVVKLYYKGRLSGLVANGGLFAPTRYIG